MKKTEPIKMKLGSLPPPSSGEEEETLFPNRGKKGRGEGTNNQKSSPWRRMFFYLAIAIGIFILGFLAKPENLRWGIDTAKNLFSGTIKSLEPAKEKLDTQMDHVMDKVDVILLMSVNPGFGGQKFIPSTLGKLRQARARIDAHVAAGGQQIALEVDGGVKTDNIAEIVAAGADVCVAGSAVFGAPDADGGYRAIMQALKQAAR